jgi:hypothetical protein
MSGAAASAGAASAAAAAARARQAEEEEMTSYHPQDLGQYEFKIIRSATGAFRNRERLEAILAEEARAGWELVEKFDSQRVRLKRLTTWRGKDANLVGQDPYRTSVGTSEAQLAICIIVAVGVTAAFIIGILVALS